MTAALLYYCTYDAPASFKSRSPLCVLISVLTADFVVWSLSVIYIAFPPLS